jgi:hypothetical protein
MGRSKGDEAHLLKARARCGMWTDSRAIGACQQGAAVPPNRGLIGYFGLVRVGDFNLRSTEHVLALGLGIFLMSVASARLFGRFQGGHAPTDAKDI